jgi:hypothetical protein
MAEEKPYIPLSPDLVPDAEDNQQVGSFTAAAAGIASGALKVPQGVASLAAELIDLGFDTNAAAGVEELFHKINVFEPIADQRLAGRITEGLVQIGVPSTIGAKVATKLATKAIQARRAGTYAELAGPNIAKGIAKAEELNKLSNTQRFAAISVGGFAGDTMVADIEKLGTFGDAFHIGPTQLDRDEYVSGEEDAGRRLMNRFKFGTESLLLTPFVYGAGKGLSMLREQGRYMAYSDSQLARTFDKIGSWFRFREAMPEEQALAKEAENALKMKDTNMAMEQVTRIDREVNKMFPEVNKYNRAASEKEKKEFYSFLDQKLFSGDIKKPLEPDILKDITETMGKRGSNPESISTVIESLQKTRSYYNDLINIASKGTGELPEGMFSHLNNLMGERVKNTIANTYSIFENKYASIYDKFRPAQDKVDKIKQIFMRYASKNGKPITDIHAQAMVDDILQQAEKMNPKVETLPAFKFQNLSAGAKDPYEMKTFARTIENELAGGRKELEVIGKGSKAFRELFGEMQDVRHSIYEGMNRLSVVARKNQMYDEILKVDQDLKSAIKDTTQFGDRGFFHDTPLDAQKAFGTNVDIVKIDNYIRDDIKGSPLVNSLIGKFTTKDIAEGFSNTAKLQDAMRGETSGSLGKTASWAYRNLILVPKAASSYAKTILSVPTQIKNFLSNGMLAIGTGTIFESPEIMAQALKKAGATVQLGLRNPLQMERYRRYLELGIADTSVNYGDLKNLMKDVKFAEGNLNTDSILRPMLNSLGVVGQGLKKIGTTAQKTYVAADDFFKIFNFEIELARRSNIYSKNGIRKTVEELEKEAADIIKNTVPNYARVGQAVRAARMSPLGNFMSFPSEIYRTGVGNIEQILKDLRDPITGSLNPIRSTNVMKGQAMKRLIGMTAATAALPYGVVEASKSIYGITDEESRAADDFVAPWAKDSVKFYRKDPETGKISYIDYSRNNIYDTLTKPFQTVLRNLQEGVDKQEPIMSGFIKGIAEAAGNVASPFVDPSIYSEAVIDVMARNGVTKDGKQLWTSDTPNNEKVSRALSHVTESFYPSYQPFLRTYKAAVGAPGKGGVEYTVPNELAGIFGQRFEDIDPKRTMGFYITDFQEGQKNARREFTGGPEGTLSGEIKTPKDLIQRYFVANQTLFNVDQRMAEHLKNAQTLGVGRGELGKLFESRGLSQDTISNIGRGKFEPFFPSDAIINRFREISAQTGQPNPWFEAQQTLREIRNKFKSQNLFTPLNIELKNFLPASESSPGGSLPLNTPMPNPNIFSQAQGGTGAVASNQPLKNGLTASENAYLSESEKAMRLKQRGLA